MNVRDRSFLVTTPEEVDSFLQRFPTGVIFKAGSCHKTMEGFSNLEADLMGRPDIHVGYIRVVENRSASNHVGELTGIVHESPQVILFVEGKPLFDLDNWAITPEGLKAGFDQHLGAGEGSEGVLEKSDMTPYIQLLEGLMTGELEEGHFKMRWLEQFRGDASPRSQDEVELLSSLYGDVDRALVGIGGEASIKSRAEDMLRMLRASDE
jgi:monothiol bacilliredoxin